MSDVQDIFGASAGQAGSANVIPPAAQGGEITNKDDGAGQGTDYKALYEELEKKFGEQGNELGGFRKFFSNVEPLLNKLDQQPEVVQAIMAGKVDSKLASAAIEGKINIVDAAIVSEAHTQVKKDLGSNQYKNMDSEEIEKLVTEKASEIANSIITTKMGEAESLNEFKQKTINFVQSTPDFEKYSDEITKWLEDHPEQDDISVAYYAIKGQKYDDAIKSGNTATMAEVAKELALNAAGGGSRGGQMPDGRSIADQLIAPRGNPNDL